MNRLTLSKLPRFHPDKTASRLSRGYPCHENLLAAEVDVSACKLNEYYSHIYLDNIVETLPHHIFWKDVDSIYLGCNRKFARLVGKTPEQIVGKSDFELGWGKGEAELYRHRDLETLTGRSTVNVEEVLDRPDGGRIVMLVNKVPLRDERDQCIGILGTSIDITEHKLAESRLKEMQERLVGVQAIGAHIAHELRTPLSAIELSAEGAQGYLPALVDAYAAAKQHGLDVFPIDPQNLEMLSRIFTSIQSEINYLDTVISIILTNAEINNAGAAEFGPQSINSCIQETMRRYPFRCGERELITLYDSSDFTFNGHCTLMVHILFNLIKNSLYYIRLAQKGGIEIWTDTSGFDNRLIFKDTGTGISENVVPLIFRKFYSTTRTGTGLGLAYSKTTMKSFGGDIVCKSTYGEYTQFEMIFPKT